MVESRLLQVNKARGALTLSVDIGFTLLKVVLKFKTVLTSHDF